MKLFSTQEEKDSLIDHIHRVLPFSEEEALTVNKIATATGLPHGRTGEQVRHLLREMIDEPYYIPIVSSAKGYWLAADVQDIEEAIKGLESRIKGIQKRIELLTEAWLIRSDGIPFDEKN